MHRERINGEREREYEVRKIDRERERKSTREEEGGERQKKDREKQIERVTD
jgi:hypothetical protein